MDPWESTGCAPQGWETHLQPSIVPVQGHIQLHYGPPTARPAFGCATGATPDPSGDATQVAPVPAHQSRAARSMSIFARAYGCNQTCSYCLAQPCDIDRAHDDHTCHSCEHTGCFIRRESPMPRGVLRFPFLPVTKSAVSLVGKSAASDICMMSMPVTGATWAVSLRRGE